MSFASSNRSAMVRVPFGTLKREYADDTYLIVRQGWEAGFVGGRVMCADGKVRRLHRIAQTADTFFSIPASVQVQHNGKRVTVAGYVTVATRGGFSTDTQDDPYVVKFRAYTYRKNHNALPEGEHVGAVQ